MTAPILWITALHQDLVNLFARLVLGCVPLFKALCYCVVVAFKHLFDVLVVKNQCRNLKFSTHQANANKFVPQLWTLKVDRLLQNWLEAQTAIIELQFFYLDFFFIAVFHFLNELFAPKLWQLYA